jgi:hypothetical protein
VSQMIRAEHRSSLLHMNHTTNGERRTWHTN